LPVTAQQMQQWAIAGGRRLVTAMAGLGGSVVVGAMGLVVDLLLTLFLLFYFLRDGAGQLRGIWKLIPMRQGHKDLLPQDIGSVPRAVVLGTLVTAIVQGTLVGLAFAVVGFPSAVVFGVLAGALSLLPVGGTAFVWGPGAIVLAAQGRWGAAIFLVAWGLLFVGVLDNLLRPLFISGRAEITTLPIFFGVLGGVAAFGPIGLFLGPVVIALALALLGFVEEGRADGSPPATDGEAAPAQVPPQAQA